MIIVVKAEKCIENYAKGIYNLHFSSCFFGNNHIVLVAQYWCAISNIYCNCKSLWIEASAK